MPKWTETNAYRIEWGLHWEHRQGFVYKESKYLNEIIFNCGGDRDSQIAAALDFIDRHHYEIKAVIPLTTGYAANGYDYSYSTLGQGSYGWGYGWGYGVTPVTGVIFMLQKILNVTEEEFAQLSEAKRMQLESRPMRAKLEQLRAEIEQDKKAPRDIVEKKALIGGMKYILGDNKFKTREEADEALRMSLKNIRSRLEESYELEQELKEIDEQIAELRACIAMGGR